MSLTAADICRSALRDLNVFDATDDIGNDDLVFVLGKLNRILDNWNADQSAIYASMFVTNTLTASLSPHTIGPTGTWTTAQRPVSIEAADLVFSTTNSPRQTITIRDQKWYMDRSVPGVTGLPTDLYYEPDWPNGKLFFYLVPDTALSVVLLVRQVLAQLALTDTFTLPPGYQDALTLTLAEAIALPYEKPVPPELTKSAAEARTRVFANNILIPTLATADSGMPRAGGSRSSGTYLNGWSQ